jgi:hypothetical protein
MAPKGSRTPWCIIAIPTVLAAIALVVFGIRQLPAPYLKTVFIGDDESLSQFCKGSIDATVKENTPPSLPITTGTFRSIEELENLSPAGDEAWHRTALTRKGGFLWVKYNETSNEAWGVSMFHALHCLKMVRMAVQASPFVKDNEMAHGHEGMAQGHKNEGSINHPDMDPTHLGHCIGYIAQVRD